MSGAETLEKLTQGSLLPEAIPNAMNAIFDLFPASVPSSERPTWIWLGVLAAGVIFNGVALVRLFLTADRPMPEIERKYRTRAKWIAALYWAASSYRALFPGAYAERLCMFPFMSPLVNRMFAFFAECACPFALTVAFAFIQKSLAAWNYGDRKEFSGFEFAERPADLKQRKPSSLLPLIAWFCSKWLDLACVLCFIANICCNTGSLCGNASWYVIEESLWMVTFAGIIPILLFAWRELNRGPLAEETVKRMSIKAQSEAHQLSYTFVMFLVAVTLCSVGIAYNDLPELTELARAPPCNGRLFCGGMFEDGTGTMDAVKDLARCHIVSKDWSHWKYTASWQTPYFTLFTYLMIKIPSMGENLLKLKPKTKRC